MGAGSPSVPTWLGTQVGRSGHVLATDIDPSWLTVPGARYEVRRHDLARDDVPEAAFDLVHARLLLVHLPARDKGLRSLARSVRPGGWLVIEDADPQLQPASCPDESGPEQRGA